MKGDFTRLTFDPSNHYRGVLMQQGRVQLDADWNENVAIISHLLRTLTRDVIGECGVPTNVDAFKIDIPQETMDPQKPDFTIRSGADDESPGRIYVGGQVCELDADTTYLTQPDYPFPPPLNFSQMKDGETRTDIIYLDVWPRIINAIEDPHLREVALGGADTSERIKMIAQVKILQNAGIKAVTCETPLNMAETGGGTLRVLVTQTKQPPDPCEPTAQGGFAGPDNRFYRVEIHNGGPLGTATFKWSRDDGSVLAAVGNFESATKLVVKSLGRDDYLKFKTGDWVEVTDDVTELSGNPGTLAKITVDEASRKLTLTPAIPAGMLARYTGPILKAASPYDRYHPKIRRWDGGAAQKITGISQPLEAGLNIQFAATANDFRPGDYWTFAARVVDGSIDPDSITAKPMPPMGIRHAYCKLAVVQWKLNGSDIVANDKPDDCRLLFPPLTHICAKDICYDDDKCTNIQAQTVQEALDALCGQRHLPFHNHHLHGWGIVCGLQIQCGPDDPEKTGDRVSVKVLPGYALDCDGNDMVLEEEEAVPVMKMIADWEVQHPDQHLLNKTDKGLQGVVSLVIELGEHGQPRISLRPYTKKDESLQGILKGTLLMDFVDAMTEKIRDLLELLNPADPAGETHPLVTAAQRQMITLLNLIYQFVNSVYGSNIFVSPKENDILHKLYLAVREILQSKTFCGLFDDVLPFPDYPFSKHRISTLFGKENHTRLRIHPAGMLAFTVGQVNNKINVYDLDSEEMVSQMVVPGGDGVVARDVAFSADGTQIYVVATTPDQNSIFATGDMSKAEITWLVSICCGVELVTLASAYSFSENLYAIAKGKGSGLYSINPKGNPIEPKLIASFEAFGHLIISEKSKKAFATANSAKTAGKYDRVLSFDLAKETASHIYTLPGGLVGEDDIILSDTRQVASRYLFVVSNSEEGDTRLLHRYSLAGEVSAPQTIDLEGDTNIHLAYTPTSKLNSRYLVISYEDFFYLRLVDISATDKMLLAENYYMPAQISPVSMAFIAPTGITLPVTPGLPTIFRRATGEIIRTTEPVTGLYVLNKVSNTITKIPLEYMAMDKLEITPVPGSEEFLKNLDTYRDQVIRAFLELAGSFLQLVKDTLCDLLLVDCPTCTPQDDVYLACVRIVNSEVFQVCNFAKRRYVKSFPTVGYWLSFAPVLPLAVSLVRKFCTLILPDIFKQIRVPTRVASITHLQGKQASQMVTYARMFNLASLTHAYRTQLTTARKVTIDWAGNHVSQTVTARQRGVAGSQLVGQPVEEARRQVEAADVQVVAVQPYDPARVGKNLIELTSAPISLKPGTKVNLYEENGVVRFYSLAETPSPAVVALQQEVAAQKATLADIGDLKATAAEMQKVRSQVEAQQAALAELQTVKASLADMQTTLAHKDDELVKLRAQIETLQKVQVTVAPAAASETRLKQMETELAELRTFREEVNKFMGRQ